MVLLVLVAELALDFVWVHAVLDVLVALDALDARQPVLAVAALHVHLAVLVVLEPALDAVVRVLADAQVDVLDALAVALAVVLDVNLRVLDAQLRAEEDVRAAAQASALVVLRVLAVVLLHVVVVVAQPARGHARGRVIAVLELAQVVVRDAEALVLADAVLVALVAV